MADLRSIAADLYGLPLGEFVGERKKRADQARKDGDKDLAKQVVGLRKPHAAAWAVNALSRERPDLVQEILDLGEELREAQAESDGARARTLNGTRRDLIRSAIAEASSLAESSGGTLSAQAASGLEETLHAGMTDPDAGDAVRDGLLVSSFAANPFEPVDLSNVLALPPDGSRERTPRKAKPAKKSAKKTATKAPSAAQRQKRTEAEAALADARERAEAAQSAVESETAEQQRLQGELDDLDDLAKELQQRVAETERDLRQTGKSVEKAERESAAARQALARAEARVDRLDR